MVLNLGEVEQLKARELVEHIHKGFKQSPKALKYFLDKSSRLLLDLNWQGYDYTKYNKGDEPEEYLAHDECVEIVKESLSKYYYESNWLNPEIDSFIISDIILFDPEIADALYSIYINEEGEMGVELGVISNTKLTPNLIKCCPSLLKRYSWSSVKEISSSLKSCIEREFKHINNVLRIYMDGEELKVSIPLLDEKYSSRWIEGLGINQESIEAFVLELTKMIPTPIKEAYILVSTDRDNLLSRVKGKIIARKCDDGEIVVTIY